MTVVYIDLLFLLNLTANYLLLLGAGRVAGAVLRRWRIALGAALGALYAVLIFLPHLEWLALWPCKLVSGVLMALLAFGGEPGLLRVTVVFFCASAGLAGAVMGLELLGGAALTLDHGVFYSRFDLRLLLLLFAACYFVMSLFFRRAARHTGAELARLELTLDTGSRALTALRDTGHTLTDPASNRPVVIVYCRSLDGLLPPCLDAAAPIESVRRCHAAGIHGARLIPYRAVGTDCGMMVAIRAKAVAVDGKPIGDLLIALSPTPVGDGGAYQALIGGI